MKPFITIKEIKQLLAEKKATPTEVEQFYLERIKSYNPALNAVIDVETPAAAARNGLLAGIPFLRKDNISRTGQTTSAGSAILKPYKAPYSATVVSNLEAAGGQCIGRANMDEFAMGATGEYSAYGPSKNPWDESKTPGGSSSGSAAAVAAGLAPFALGTETGGSVRQPAAFCNLVGLYPTYGRNSRFGVVAFASSNDQVGCFTKTVYDNALVQSVLGGNDKQDATSVQQGPIDYTKDLDGKLPAGLRVGVLKDGFTAQGVDEEVKTAFENSIQTLQKLGATTKEVEIPSWKYGIAIYFVISRAEAASNLSRFDGSLYGLRAKDFSSLKDMYEHTRQEGFGTEIKRRILVGNYVLSAGHKDAYYGQACRVRAMIKAEFDALFNDFDVIVSPTTPTLPFSLGGVAEDPFSVYMADYFVLPNNMIGTPALAVPAGFSRSGLPIGMQFLGRRLSEELLYKVGHAFEQATGYYTHNPKGYQ